LFGLLACAHYAGSGTHYAEIASPAQVPTFRAQFQAQEDVIEEKLVADHGLLVEHDTISGVPVVVVGPHETAERMRGKAVLNIPRSLRPSAPAPPSTTSCDPGCHGPLVKRRPPNPASSPDHHTRDASTGVTSRIVRKETIDKITLDAARPGSRFPAWRFR
jgi:hypothetical protein